jgi:hypothetical protein
MIVMVRRTYLVMHGVSLPPRMESSDFLTKIHQLAGRARRRYNAHCLIARRWRKNVCRQHLYIRQHLAVCSDSFAGAPA